MEMTTEQMSARLRELAGDKLEQLMSDISEDHYAAGWMSDLQFELWTIVRGGDRSYGMGDIEESKVADLKQLSDECDGWCDGERIVPLSEWRQQFAVYWRDRHIPACRNNIPSLESRVGAKPSWGREITAADVAKSRAQLADAEAELPKILSEAGL